MKTSAKCTILKNSAKNVMAGKYYFAIMALLFAGLISILFNRFTYNLNRSICLTLIDLLKLSASSAGIIVLSYLLPFLLSVVLNVLHLGICLFFLNLTTNHPFFTFDLTYGYFHDFGKSLRLSGVLTLLSFICFLPADVYLDLRDQGFRLNSTELLLFVAIQLLLIAIYLPVSLALSQSYYVMLDYPELSTKEVFKKSAQIMKGRKKQLFYVRLSFLPLFVICLLTLGLGLFWLIPYYHVTMALYYLDVMKPTDPVQ